jgi:hypothetical protein
MPQDMVVRSLSDNDLSTAANDPRPSASFSARKNPQCSIPANTPPVFPGLRPRIWPHLVRLVTNGNVGQAPSPYNPKRLLLKMLYRFNKSCQLLSRHYLCALYDWFPAVDFQRSRP